jgi:Ca2+-binding EF-hand superfamily protein
MHDLAEVFSLVDMDHSGKICIEEMKSLTHTVGLVYSNDELYSIFQEVLSNDSNEIDFESFVLCVTKKVQVKTCDLTII